jgi:hypothetical protein
MEQTNPGLDELLQRFKPVLGKDFEKYHNHVYRVFLNCLLLDEAPGNREKYTVAAVFHDIGIWTNHTFDYLDPSIAQVKIYLDETRRPDWFGEISNMIYWHHKLSAYRGEHGKTVEIFRKADWVDVSLGLLRFGVDPQKAGASRRHFPNAGFHLFLVKQSVRNFFRHPLNPLPVFKR